MTTLNDQIATINARVQQLLKKYEALQKENEKYRDAVNLLQKEQQQIKEENERLQQQNLILKTAASPLDEKDKKAFEQKINAYLRSIDKCISTLGQ
ncbi:MAG: hypothetical protein JWQ27_1086 [Ferruginibacter sp.]|nr:hypothetical protein [Ferruginibacter sp.]